MREKYEKMSLVMLRELARERKIRHISAMKKSEVIDALLAYDENMDVPEKTADRAEGISLPEQLRPEPADSADGEIADVPEKEDFRERENPQPVMRVTERTTGTASVTSERVVGLPGRAGAAERSQGTSPRTGVPRTMSRTKTSGEKTASRNGTPGARQTERTYGTGARPAERQISPAGRTQNDRSTAGASRQAADRNGTGTARQAADRNGAGASRQNADRTGASYARTGDRPAVSPEKPVSVSRPQVEESVAYAMRPAVENYDRPPMDLASLDSGEEASGILEVLSDGYGFIRSDNYLPGENDVYVAPSQIRRFGLKTGDIIRGNTRIRAQQEKFSALLYLKTINGYTPSEAAKRYNFEDMTPVFPNRRMRMERSSREIASRIVDLFSPIGKGQRGMIVSPPKAGKTTLLKDVARSILQNEKDMHLLILLIDERPEEVTDIREAITGENVEVIYSTFDELPEHHKRVSEMGIERAKRLVEHGKDVTILLDSITRLARAYNLTVPPSGRTLSGGLDPTALHMPKRFFGSARNMREGGSLTILATALVDTGSKMDDVVYEEFKGTGNMELVLDRKLSERRIFPAIDIQKSSTRREDLLLSPEEQEAMYIMRKALNGMKSDEAVENILNMFVHTRDNEELVNRVRRQRFI